LTDEGVEPSRVLVVDDDPIVRSAVVAALRGEGYDVTEVDSGEAALERAKSIHPDVVTMDILMPPGMSGIDATRRLVIERPETRVVMFSVRDAAEVVAVAVAAGATSYITKKAGLPALLDAVSRTVAGQAVLIPAPSSARPALTSRERQIAELAAKGVRNREIADQLYLSPRTVENHLQRIFAKVGVSGRGELAGKVADGEFVATHAPSELSQAEQRVAALAAQGLTNQTIAQRLFITRSTVEQHLVRVYRKLGVNRRTELADLVGDGAEELNDGQRTAG
jgi:DNA-binding NarL/FixJ family response regulator